MWEREYDADILEYLDDKYQGVLIVNLVNTYGILKNGCTVELYLGDTEHQITIHNLQELDSAGVHKIEINLNNEHSARSLYEILEEALTTNTESKYMVCIDTELCLIAPIHLEVKRSKELLYSGDVVDIKRIKEK